jgi:hypothetical protein
MLYPNVMTRTPATAAALALMLSLIGVTMFLVFEQWFGTFAASALIVGLSAAGAWFEAKREEVREARHRHPRASTIRHEVHTIARLNMNSASSIDERLGRTVNLRRRGKRRTGRCNPFWLVRAFHTQEVINLVSHSLQLVDEPQHNPVCQWTKGLPECDPLDQALTVLTVRLGAG